MKYSNMYGYFWEEPYIFMSHNLSVADMIINDEDDAMMKIMGMGMIDDGEGYDGTRSKHASYLSFFLHGQDFWICCLWRASVTNMLAEWQNDNKNTIWDGGSTAP